MKKAFPLLSAGALLFSGVAPVFAAEEETPPTTEETPDVTVDEEVIAAANEKLEALKAVDTKSLTEEQATALAGVIEALEAAIEAQDEAAITDAVTDADAILNALNTPETPTEDSELVTNAKALLDKVAIAITQYSAQWEDIQVQEITDMSTALQAAITSGDEEAIQKAMDALTNRFAELGIDLNEVSEDNPPEETIDAKNPKGAANSTTNTGIESMAGPLASGIAAMAVCVGGLTYKIRKSE